VLTISDFVVGFGAFRYNGNYDAMSLAVEDHSRCSILKMSYSIVFSVKTSLTKCIESEIPVVSITCMLRMEHGRILPNEANS
jgi:hypothetical protein